MSVSRILKVFDFFEIIHSNTLNFGTFYDENMRRYIPTLVDVSLNRIYAYNTSDTDHVSTGAPNFIENPCNVEMISTIQ